MFMFRDPDHYIQEFHSGCISTTPRHIHERALLNDCLVQDLTDLMLYPLLGVMAQRSGRCNYEKHQKDQKESKWVKTLKLKGFTPDGVKITTNEGRILVNARSVKREGDNTDIHETNRVIPIPDNVNINSMKSHFTDGLLTIEAMMTVEDKTKKDTLTEVQIKKELHETSEQMPDGISATDNCSTQSDSPKEEGSGEDLTEYQMAEGIVEYPESLASQDFEQTDGENVGTDDFTETTNEEVTSSKADHRETKSDFKLLFDKDQYCGDDVKVLHKGDTLLVKSVKKVEEDGLTCMQYYSTEYKLPEDLDMSNLSCSRNSEGVLTVTAPYKQL